MTTVTPPEPKPEPAQSTTSTSWKRSAADAFSFPVMCMFLLMLLIFGFSVRRIAEPDIWWHLRNASNLLEHHSFSRVDTYSFTAAGAPWLSDQWLAEVPFFLAFKARSLQGLLAVYFAALVLIYTGVYYRCLRAGADCKSAAGVTALAIFLGVVSTGPRTLLFGWLCLVGLLLVLDRFQRTGEGLWLLPPLFALWINLHGSWVFGMVVLVLTIASGLVEGEWGLVVARRWSPADLKKLLLALATSLAALFVNPFGYKLVLYPFTFLLRHQSGLQALEEWQPVDFGTGNGKLALMVILALVAAALLSSRRWRLDEVLLTAFVLWEALSHVRFLFFAALVVAPILAPRLKLFPPYERKLDKPWLNAGIMAAVVASLIFLFPSSAELQQQVDEQYPKAALEFMQRQPITGRIFNDYGWGGYMEWNTPALKTFIDGRADIFMYNDVFNDHVNAIRMKQPLEVLDKYKIDYALLPPKQPLTYLLEHSPAWRTVYFDKVAVLLERVPASQWAPLKVQVN